MLFIYLLPINGRKNLQQGSSDFGHVFEHLMIQEIIAYLGYHFIEEGLSCWHTYSGLEVDAVIGLPAIDFLRMLWNDEIVDPTQL